MRLREKEVSAAQEPNRGTKEARRLVSSALSPSSAAPVRCPSVVLPEFLLVFFAVVNVVIPLD